MIHTTHFTSSSSTKLLQRISSLHQEKSAEAQVTADGLCCYIYIVHEREAQVRRKYKNLLAVKLIFSE